MKEALVLGAGGFIGGHLVKRLRRDGFRVRGVDLKRPPYAPTEAHEFVVADLRDPAACRACIDRGFDEVYQLAADMGGAGFVFTGENDADILHNSALVNLNVLDACRRAGSRRVFYASSACVYPAATQRDPAGAECAEDSVYPAEPDSDYGWEKLFGERLYLAYARNAGMETRIARYHNVFGPEGAWNDGREKAPAALCRKVAEAEDGGEIEIWGDGRQTRTFLYVDECIEGTVRLMRSGCREPLNVGSDERISIDGLATMIMELAGKRLRLRHVPGPIGVAGRSSDNRRIAAALGWRPVGRLRDGLAKTYPWIERQARARAA